MKNKLLKIILNKLVESINRPIMVIDIGDNYIITDGLISDISIISRNKRRLMNVQWTSKFNVFYSEIFYGYLNKNISIFDAIELCKTFKNYNIVKTEFHKSFS